MSKKKMVFDSMIIVIAFFLFTVWYNKTIRADYEEANTTNVMDKYIIYFIPMDDEDEFWQYVNQGASDMAEMLGVTYRYDAPDKRDVDEQIEIVNNAVARNAEAILIAASDPVRLSSVIEDAKARGVKIIYVDSPAVEEGATTLATDNYNAGRMAGETMLMKLIQQGITSGSIGIIGVTPENITTMDREQGFREVITADGRFDLLDTKYTNGVVSISKQAVDRYRGDVQNLVGIFATNEGTTEGTGNALENTDENIVVIGFDYTKTIQEMINNGQLKAVMVQNPYTMGYLGMATAVAALKGYDTGAAFISTGISVIDANTPKQSLPSLR